MCMTFVSTGAYPFVLGKQALENSKEVKLRQLENNQYKNAWEYMTTMKASRAKRKWKIPGRKVGNKTIEQKYKQAKIAYLERKLKKLKQQIA